jgi:tetratricopeptide (TPR) repeat protein
VVSIKSRQRRVCVVLMAAFLTCAWVPLAAGQTAPYPGNDLITQASAARMQNDIPRAIELYSRAVEVNPKSPDGWWFLGSLQYETGAYVPARDALSHYIEMIPSAGPAFALRGLCEFETGEYAGALGDIQKGISLGAANQPRHEQILRYHEALLLTRLEHYAAALKKYDFFVKKGVTNPELLIAIGLAGLRMPLLPKDVTAEQQGLVSAAGDAAYRSMAGDETSAAQSFKELFEHFPAAPNAHFLYGYLLFATDPDAALLQFNQELAISPSSMSVEEMTAWCLLVLNRPAEALPYARTLAENQPESPAAQLVLARSLLETGDTNRGMEHLQTALQMDPKNLEAHLALAKAYSKSGRKEEARRERILCLQLSNESATTTQP